MKQWTQDEVAQTIDHAVLKPEFTPADVQANAMMCIERNVKSMCVRPCDVALAYSFLKDSNVDVSVVVGFPHGSNHTDTKALETERAAQDGAVEMDMVMNIGRFLAGDADYVRDDIAAVVEAAKQNDAIVKVIMETCFLSLEQVAEACELACEAGAAFVKTSTGFAHGPATPEVVDVMIKTVGDRMKIKPSGGIRTWETAVGYLNQGADRLGVGSTEAVLDGGEADGGY